MDACCLAADFSMQGVAISLLMDLVGLTQSVAMVTAESFASGASGDSAQPRSPSQGRVSVVIRPPLTQGILKYIADKTDFFKVLHVSPMMVSCGFCCEEISTSDCTNLYFKNTCQCQLKHRCLLR